LPSMVALLRDELHIVVTEYGNGIWEWEICRQGEPFFVRRTQSKCDPVLDLAGATRRLGASASSDFAPIVQPTPTKQLAGYRIEECFGIERLGGRHRARPDYPLRRLD
jgi:hypothetical protein